MGEAPSDLDVIELGKKILAWAEKEGRRPPWREFADPYRLAVAEILLQKTKARDVEPIWEQVVHRFSTPHALADAKEEEVFTIVQPLGLGTQRTSRLKRMAAELATRGASSPLGGLGPYGQAVIDLSSGRQPSSIPVDGNVARMISRYYGMKFDRGEPRKKPEVRAAVAQLLAHESSPLAKLKTLYGLVDLGDAVCKPRKPNCAVCPVAPACQFAQACARDATNSRTAEASANARGGGTASETRRI
jgi:A/G-specific adenine glycosylase